MQEGEPTNPQTSSKCNGQKSLQFMFTFAEAYIKTPIVHRHYGEEPQFYRTKKSTCP